MFEQLVLTNNGTALLAALMNGHQIDFTKIKLGNAANEPASIITLNDLVSTKKTLNIARKSIISTNKVNVGANLMGVDITEAFNWTEVGIFARDVTAGGAEVLFSYQYATTPVPIPVGGTVAEMLLDFIIQVGDAENVNIEIDSSLIFVTQADINTLHNTITAETTASINTLVNNTITPLSQALTAHTGNTNNPHNVSKAQVGLGNVVNQGVATEVEAKAGSSDTKYMTPLKVKNTLEGMGVITDGNIIIKIQNTQPAAISGKTIIWINTGS